MVVVPVAGAVGTAGLSDDSFSTATGDGACVADGADGSPGGATMTGARTMVALARWSLVNQTIATAAAKIAHAPATNQSALAYRWPASRRFVGGVRDCWRGVAATTG